MTLSQLLFIMSLFLPLGLGLLQLVRPMNTHFLAIVSAFPALVIALFVPIGTTFDVAALLLGTVLTLDNTGQTFLFFTSLLWLIAGVFASFYLHGDERRDTFFAFFLLAMAGNFGLILAGDMISFYLWFALMSFASYGLIVHDTKDTSYYAGRIYMALVIIGELLLFAGLMFVIATTGTTRFDALIGYNLDNLTVTLIITSFGIKAGLVGLHLWLPLAHPAAPVPASAVLSGAMIKAGLLGWLRFLSPADIAPVWGEIFILLGLITAFYGAIMGVSHINPKTVLAYSSISQMGFITVGVGVWLMLGDAGTGALIAIGLYALHHALAKGALFLGVAFAGMHRIVPFILLIPALALAGLPLTSGAIAKTILKSAATPLSIANLESLLSLGAIGTTLLMIRFLWLIWGTTPPNKSLPSPIWGAWNILIACVALLMFFIPEANAYVQESLKLDKIVTALTPIGIGILLGVFAYFALRWVRQPLIPSGDLLIVVNAIITVFAFIGRALLNLLSRADNAIANNLDIRLLYVAKQHIDNWELRLRTDAIVTGSALIMVALAILILSL